MKKFKMLEHSLTTESTEFTQSFTETFSVRSVPFSLWSLWLNHFALFASSPRLRGSKYSNQ